MVASVAFFSFPQTAGAYYKAPFIKPLDGQIIVCFRQQYWDETDMVERRHTGVDIDGSAGDSIRAAANGTVSYTGISPVGGRTVVIKHNEKIRTTYLNLEQVIVSPGTYVRQNGCIGIIGAQDDPSSKTIHLHFGVIYDSYYLDPEDLLGIDYSSISRYLTLEYVYPDMDIEFN